MTDKKREKGSSITRILEIVEAVSRAERPMSATEVAFQLDIPKPSAHRLVQQLEAEGFLQTNMRGHLQPGQRLQEIALGVLHSNRFKAQRQAILKHLAHQIGETCGIALPDGTEMIYYDRVQTNWPLQIHLPVGSRVPVWCSASGKLYLSTLSKSQRNRVIQHLPLEKRARNTLTDIDSLEQALRAIRKTDIGIDNEEFIDGMVACSVPIRDNEGKLFACLFTHAPLIRKSLDELLTFEPLLRRAAGELADMVASRQDALEQ